MNPERFALLGHPLGHSLSPFLHARLFALSGREAVYTDSQGNEVPIPLEREVHLD